MAGPSPSKSKYARKKFQESSPSSPKTPPAAALSSGVEEIDYPNRRSEDYLSPVSKKRRYREYSDFSEVAELESMVRSLHLRDFFFMITE